jgi:hypothetical protein
MTVTFMKLAAVFNFFVFITKTMGFKVCIYKFML